MMDRIRMTGISCAVGTQPVVKRVSTHSQASAATGTVCRLALIPSQLLHLTLQLRVHIPSAIFALNMNPHLLEALFYPLLEWLQGLVDSRSMDDQSRFHQRDLQSKQFLQLRHGIGVFRVFQQIAICEKGLLVVADAAVDGSVDDALELHRQRMQGEFGIGSV